MAQSAHEFSMKPSSFLTQISHWFILVCNWFVLVSWWFMLNSGWIILNCGWILLNSGWIMLNSGRFMLHSGWIVLIVFIDRSLIAGSSLLCHVSPNIITTCNVLRRFNGSCPFHPAETDTQEHYEDGHTTDAEKQHLEICSV